MLPSRTAWANKMCEAAQFYGDYDASVNNTWHWTVTLRRCLEDAQPELGSGALPSWFTLMRFFTLTLDPFYTAAYAAQSKGA